VLEGEGSGSIGALDHSPRVIGVRVLFLGKSRYRTRPDFQGLVRRGAELGHQVTLVDRDEFLGQAMSEFDLVFAKSHYKDDAVRSHLEEGSVHVVNALAATAACESRRQIATRLMDADVPTPSFLAMDDSTIGAGVRCIAKPDRGGDHRLEILDSLPVSPDPNVFYQQWLPASTVWKVYTVGTRHWQVELTYSSTAALSDPKRSQARPASERLVQAANAVASTLGLAVFNTDFIDNGGLLYAIDVNPFPGLSGLPGAAEALWSLAEATARR